jgi:hypothetical protein
MKYLYTPLYRPPGAFSLPKGWTLIERPALVPNNFERRKDLPVSQYPHGVVGFDSKLPPQDVADFQLRFLGSEQPS